MTPSLSNDALLIAGDEPVEELRSKISKYSLRCPLDQAHPRCPFSMFGLLNTSARENLIKVMTHEACVHFFELERECRAEAAR